MGPIFAQGDGDFLLYDGECPFCSAYIRMQRLRAAGVRLQLIDARQDPEKVRALAAHGIDINQGMFMRLGGSEFFGADVINAVALMTGPTGMLNRALGWVFRHRSVARLVYPGLRTGRNIALCLLGHQQITLR